METPNFPHAPPNRGAGTTDPDALLAIGIVPAGARTGCAVWRVAARQYRSVSEGTALAALAVVERARRKGGSPLVVIGTRGGAQAREVRLWDAWLAAAGVSYRLASTAVAPWDAARLVAGHGWPGAASPLGLEAAALVGGVTERHLSLWRRPA